MPLCRRLLVTTFFFAFSCLVTAVRDEGRRKKDKLPPPGHRCCCNEHVNPWVCRDLPGAGPCPENKSFYGELQPTILEATPDLTYKQSACLMQDAAAFQFPLTGATDPSVRIAFSPENIWRIRRIRIRDFNAVVHIENMNMTGQMSLSVEGSTTCQEKNKPTVQGAYTKVSLEGIDGAALPDISLEIGVVFKLKGVVSSYQEAWQWDENPPIVECINLGDFNTNIWGGKALWNLWESWLKKKFSLHIVMVVSKLIARMPQPTGAGSGMHLQSLFLSVWVDRTAMLDGKSLILEWSSKQLWKLQPHFMARWLCRDHEECKVMTKFTDILQSDEDGVLHPKNQPLQVKSKSLVQDGKLSFNVDFSMALNVASLLEALNPNCDSSNQLCVRAFALPSNVQSSGERAWSDHARNLAQRESVPCLVMDPPQIELHWSLTINAHRDRTGPGLLMQLTGADQDHAAAAEVQCVFDQWLCIGTDACNLARDVLGDSLSLKLAVRQFGMIMRPSEEGLALESCFVAPCPEASGLHVPRMYVTLLTPTASVNFRYDEQVLGMQVGLRTSQLLEAFTNQGWIVAGGTTIRGHPTGHRLSINKEFGNEILVGSIEDVDLTELSGRLFLNNATLSLSASLGLRVKQWSCNHWICDALSSTMLGSTQLKLEVQLDGRITQGKFQRLCIVGEDCDEGGGQRIAPTMTMSVTGKEMGASGSSLFAGVVVNRSSAVMTLNVQVALKTLWEKWHDDFIGKCEESFLDGNWTCERLQSLYPRDGRMQLIIPSDGGQNNPDDVQTFDFMDLGISAKARFLASCHNTSQNSRIRVNMSIMEFDIIFNEVAGTLAKKRNIKMISKNRNVRVKVKVTLLGFLDEQEGFIACRASTKKGNPQTSEICSSLFADDKTVVAVRFPETMLPRSIAKWAAKELILNALNKLVTQLAPVLRWKTMQKGQCNPNSVFSVFLDLERVLVPGNNIGVKASIDASYLGGNAVAVLFESFGGSIVDGIEELLPAVAALHIGGEIKFFMDDTNERPFRSLFGDNEALRLDMQASHPLAHALGQHMQDLALQLGQTLSGEVSSNLMSQYNALLLSVEEEDFSVAASIEAKTVDQTLRAIAAFRIEGLDTAKQLTAIPGASEGLQAALYNESEWSKSRPMEWSPPMEREPLELFTAYADSQLASELTFDGEDLNVEAQGHVYINEDHMFRSLMDSARPHDYGFAFGAGLLRDETSSAERFAWLNCGVLKLWDPADVAGGRNGGQAEKVLKLLNMSLSLKHDSHCFQLEGRNMENSPESFELCTDSNATFMKWFSLLEHEPARLQQKETEETCEVKEIGSMPEHRMSHICQGSRCEWVVETPRSLAQKLQNAARAAKGWWRMTLS